jgi:hypothetical protein
MVRSVTPAGRLSGPQLGERLRWYGVLAGAFFAPPVLVLGLWLGVHRIPGVAPFVADSLRVVLGVDGVARLEEFVYGMEDRFNRVWRGREKPKAYWTVPPVAPAPVLPHPAPVLPPQGPPPPPAPDANDGVSLFRPADVGPVYASSSAPGDGQWVVLPDGTSPEDARMYKTLLHPDDTRSWAELFVVALDLRRIRLYLVAGTQEPQATAKDALDVQRPGRIPEDQQATVLAAFNGGFKTEHGHYGMATNGVTLVPARDEACTIAYFKDHTLRIAAAAKLIDQLEDTLWWRQTPACMFENGKMNPRLAGGFDKRWGSTLDGETVIRRSAMGLDASGTTLYVGISNHTTASIIARGMRHAGAVDVAQLDINYSFPKFVTYRSSGESRQRLAVSLAEGFESSENEYMRKASTRDFFYVTAGARDGRTASK